MMDKDKIYLVAYINVADIDREDISPYLLQAKNALLPHDESVEVLVIPVYETDTHIDCINPVLLSAEERDKLKKKMDALVKMAEDALKNLKVE